MEVTTTTATEIRTASAQAGGTVTESSGDNGDYEPIVDHLMKEKFQLYNQTRQRLPADVKRTTPLKPFTMFTNSKQSDKPFFSVGYSWNVTRDMYTVDLIEYDNSTVVNLVEG